MVMNSKKKKILLTVLLVVSLVNYARMAGTEDIRTVEFLSIFAIGAISALLINDVFGKENEE